MKEENKLWAVKWTYADGSQFGIVNNIAYECWQAAHHIRDTLAAEGFTKVYTVIELGVVRGELS